MGHHPKIGTNNQTELFSKLVFTHNVISQSTFPNSE